MGGSLRPALALIGALCAPAFAADFGVMETAEPIEPQRFKLGGHPIVTDAAHGPVEDGFAVGVGYGLPYGLDVEGQIARYEDATYFGSDLEWSPWRNHVLQFSFGGGVHTIDLPDGGVANGLDSTGIITFMPAPRLDVSIALDLTFEDVDVEAEGAGTPDGRYATDNTYETVYAVPGVEYQLSHNLDVLGEVGVGLNGASDDYFSAGLSWYFR